MIPRRTSRWTRRRFLKALGIGAGALALSGKWGSSQTSVASWIDTHVHFPGPSHRTRDCFSSAIVSSALANMDANGILKSLIMPPPRHVQDVNYSDLVNLVKAQPGRFAFLAGGDSLNPMIQTAVESGQVSVDLQRGFEEKAAEIIKAGAVGFGETTATRVMCDRPKSISLSSSNFLQRSLSRLALRMRFESIS